MPMNLITHAKFALDLFKNERLAQKEKDELIVGSIMPDAANLGLAEEEETHTRGLFFLQKHGHNSFHFGAGMVSHGEKPGALDFYTHHPKTGYISQKEEKIVRIMRQYPECWRGIDPHWAAHTILEYSIDSLLAEKYVYLPEQISDAFSNPHVKNPTRRFARFFHARKFIAESLGNGLLHGYIKSFKNTRKTALSWMNFASFNLARPANIHGLPGKLILLGRYGFYTLRNKLRFRTRKRTTQMFEQVKSHLEKDAEEFLAQTKERVEKIKEAMYQQKFARNAGQPVLAKKLFGSVWRNPRIH